MTSLRQPELEGSVVGAGGNQFAIRRHVDAHHLKDKHRSKSNVPEESPIIRSNEGKAFVPCPHVRRASSAASSWGDSKPSPCCRTLLSTGSGRLWLHKGTSGRDF